MLSPMLASDMPPGFTEQQLQDVAALANLQLEGAEIELFARQLGEVLAYVEALQQVDTTGVPPTAQVVTRHQADRPDVVQPGLDRDEALANAPDPALDAGLFKVPQVIG